MGSHSRTREHIHIRKQGGLLSSHQDYTNHMWGLKGLKWCINAPCRPLHCANRGGRRPLCHICSLLQAPLTQPHRGCVHWQVRQSSSASTWRQLMGVSEQQLHKETQHVSKRALCGATQRSQRLPFYLIGSIGFLALMYYKNWILAWQYGGVPIFPSGCSR